MFLLTVMLFIKIAKMVKVAKSKITKSLICKTIEKLLKLNFNKKDKLI